MSFSEEVKKELKNFTHICPECKKLQTHGEVIFNKQHKKDDYNFSFTVENIKECCLSSFIRGVFLSCGGITDPKKEYHLEFSVADYKLSENLNYIISYAYHNAGENQYDLCGIPLIFKTVKRKNNIILYQKDSEKIEDILTMMGAVKSSLSIMNVKIYKDVRNNVNRARNCDTANISKTVEVASRQVNDIRFIERVYGFEKLPETLREIAAMRLNNPEKSLKELSEALDGKISRSGINHRLKKISIFADELRKGKI